MINLSCGNISRGGVEKESAGLNVLSGAASGRSLRVCHLTVNPHTVIMYKRTKHMKAVHDP